MILSRSINRGLGPHPAGMEIDWSQKMRPPAPKLKIIEDRPRRTGGTLFFTNRPELYEALRDTTPKDER